MRKPVLLDRFHYSVGGSEKGFQTNFSIGGFAVNNLNTSTASAQETVFFARASLLEQLKGLNYGYPNIGFGISLRTYTGEHYLLANNLMPLPAVKSDGFPTARSIAHLDNGDRFSSVEVLADAVSFAGVTAVEEADILCNALELISRIDTLSSIPAGRITYEPRFAATGTEG